MLQTLTDIQSLKTTEPMSVSAAIKELDRTTSSLDDTVKRFSTSTWNNPALQKNGSDVIVGHHHLQGLAPKQLQEMQERLSVMLEQNAERCGEEMLYEEMSRHGGLRKAELSLHSVQEFARDRSEHRSRQAMAADRTWHAGGDRSDRHSDRTWHLGAFFGDRSPTPRPTPRRGGPSTTDIEQAAGADDTLHSNVSLSDLAQVRGPGALDRTLTQMETHDDDGILAGLFNKTSALELWYENRHASLERYVGFLVLFHAMAARVASFVPLSFQVWRSQSQLRVATVSGVNRNFRQCVSRDFLYGYGSLQHA
jgi:hypothetical protein